ncbi:hypothetical protein [Neomegalonema sp.]|uniref:hypothetical protein n=1 Tax=Neomegalonema sp. TaxID=2039713 RepID=UPI0026034651|nr:hypothetical protein [Neomegalonema sp.]MDD2867474.1 hypothetical protein [Neomegalonema sp.]
MKDAPFVEHLPDSLSGSGFRSIRRKLLDACGLHNQFLGAERSILLLPFRESGAAPFLIVTPGARPPPPLIQSAAGGLVQGGDPLQEAFPAQARVARFDSSIGLTYERGDRDYTRANLWSDRLSRRLEQDFSARESAYFEPVRRLIRSSAAQNLALNSQLLQLTRETRQGEPVVIVAGERDWRPLADALLRAGMGDAGLAVLLCGAHGMDNLRMAWCAFQDRIQGLWGGSFRSASSLAGTAALLKPDPLPEDSLNLVAADLRNPEEGRWAPAALAILEGLTLQDEPCVLAPQEPLRRRWRRWFSRRRRPFEGTHEAASPFMPVRPPRTPLWLRPSLERIFEDFRTEEDAGAFLLEASRRMFAEWPRALAAGEAVEAWCARDLRRRVYCVPGNGRLLGMTAALAARRAGATSVEVQTLLVSRSPRYDSPLATHVACLDRHQRAIYVEHMGHDPERVVVVGSILEAALMQKRRARARKDDGAREDGAPEGAPILLYPTQGLHHLDALALSFLHAAHLEDMGWEIVVTTHPSMSAQTRKDIERKLGRKVFRNRKSDDVLNNPDLKAVCTLFSNVGYSAALRGIPVLRLNMDENITTDFPSMGFAHDVDRIEDLQRMLSDIPALQQRNAEYMKEFRSTNPELFDGLALERILNIR